MRREWVMRWKQKMQQKERGREHIKRDKMHRLDKRREPERVVNGKEEGKKKPAGQEINVIKICCNSEHFLILNSFMETSVINGDKFDFHHTWYWFQMLKTIKTDGNK